MIAVICVVFGLLGGLMAYLNAYEGYNHHPGISGRKKSRFALEMAAFAFLMAAIAGAAAYCLFNI